LAQRWNVKATSGCATVHHTYTRTIKVGHRTPLALSIHDPDQWGADGQLKVTVRRLH